MHTVSRPTETVPTNLRAETFLDAMATQCSAGRLAAGNELWAGAGVSSARQRYGRDRELREFRRNELDGDFAVSSTRCRRGNT